MTRETLIKHVRAVVLRYKERCTVEQVAERVGYKPSTVRNILKSKTMRPYVMRLTNGFIEKARGYFDEMVAEMQSGDYNKKVTPKVQKADPKTYGYQPPRRARS